MTAFFGDLGFVRCIAASSSTLGPADVGDGFSFCHVDGGHTAAETYHDLDLCSRVLLPGGLLALDDYFNPAFPGVCEGAIKFWLDHGGALTPVAAGFNKVFFQKPPARFDLNEAFNQRFPYIPHKTVTLWETPVQSFSSFGAFIDAAPRARVVSCPTTRFGWMPCWPSNPLMSRPPAAAGRSASRCESSTELPRGRARQDLLRLRALAPPLRRPGDGHRSARDRD